MILNIIIRATLDEGLKAVLSLPCFCLFQNSHPGQNGNEVCLVKNYFPCISVRDWF